MPATVACPSCNAAVQPDQRFCGHCGRPLTRACPACGAENSAAHRFCGGCGVTLEAEPLARAAEERRWVTVLFADLTGFTALSERMDPEDVKALAHRCAERISAEVRRFGGTVIDVMGDSVLAVFGAPIAHEDDAERAVRAGLAIRDCSLTDARGTPIPVHVGINTGEVMAGQIGPTEHRQYAVLGDTTNTASRLMSAAPPGAVLVGPETFRATHRAVRYREVVPVGAKGKEHPIPAWEALEPLAAPHSRPLGSARLVGRQHELDLLSALWAKVTRERRPHLVTILGEAGVGKSRLVTEFERQALGNALVLHGRCLPYGEALGYWALATALRTATGITPEDDVSAARAKLSTVVADVIGPTRSINGEQEEITRHLALLCGLDTPADRESGAGNQRLLHGSATRFLEALGSRSPVCLMFEDIHWADDALLDLIEFAASRVQSAALLIVAQARPELLEKRPSWGRGVRAFSSLPLEPLDETAGRELLLALCQERGLAEAMAQQLGPAAGGNPLFAEELVATVLERGGVREVPSSIKLLILARLDALSPDERHALQRATIFGKAFWEGGVRALGVAGPVAEHLDSLERKDLVRAHPRSHLPGEREYEFKHDLIRDAAYETLPRGERRALHGRALDWLERAGSERPEELLSVLAHHAVQAQQHDRALAYLTRAAERARLAAAHREEAHLLAQALEVAEQAGRGELVPGLRAQRGRAFSSVGQWDAARRELETALAMLPPQPVGARAELLVDLSTVCFWSLDTPGFRRYASEAVSVANAHGDHELTASAMAWLAEVHKVDGDEQASVALYEEALALAGGVRTPPLANASLVFYHQGRISEAVAYARAGVELVRARHDTSAVMWTLPHLGLALAASGQYAEAAKAFDEARQFGTTHEVWPLLARAVAMSVGFHLDVFDLAGAEQLAEEARDLGRSSGFMPSEVSAGIDLLLSHARAGEIGRAERLQPAVAETVHTTANWHGWLWKLRLAEAMAEIALARGDLEEAIRRAGAAIEQGRQRGRVKYEVLGLGTRATALSVLGRTREAIGDLRRALSLARPLGDPALVLRPAARLLILEGDEALLGEGVAARDRIAASLPDGGMRARFAATEAVQILSRLTR